MLILHTAVCKHLVYIRSEQKYWVSIALLNSDNRFWRCKFVWSYKLSLYLASLISLSGVSVKENGS